MITQEMEQKQDLDQALKHNLDPNPKVQIRITWVTDLSLRYYRMENTEGHKR